MKLLLSYIIGLFLILSLSACHDGGNATTLLHQADSLMQEFPDSALSLLESISHPEKLSGSERADYAIFLTRARTKLYVHESSDSEVYITAFEEVGIMSVRCKPIIIGVVCIETCGVWIWR